MTTLKFAIAGASGRMGRMLIETVLNTPDAQLVGALDIPSSSHLGQDPAAFLGKNTGIKITADLKEGLNTVEERARHELGMVKANEIFVQIEK
jgi:4-hydroxy-tetrahydrodipicolinate reductase